MIGYRASFTNTKRDRLAFLRSHIALIFTHLEVRQAYILTRYFSGNTLLDKLRAGLSVLRGNEIILHILLTNTASTGRIQLPTNPTRLTLFIGTALAVNQILGQLVSHIRAQFCA